MQKTWQFLSNPHWSSQKKTTRNINHGEHIHVYDFVQDCSNSTADMLDLPQTCTEPSKLINRLITKQTWGPHMGTNGEGKSVRHFGGFTGCCNKTRSTKLTLYVLIVLMKHKKCFSIFDNMYFLTLSIESWNDSVVNLTNSIPLLADDLTMEEILEYFRLGPRRVKLLMRAHTWPLRLY